MRWHLHATVVPHRSWGVADLAAALEHDAARGRGTILVAHSGACRVGYVSPGSVAGRWTWKIAFATGGGMPHLGREGDEQSAQRALENAFWSWVQAANLRRM